MPCSSAAWRAPATISPGARSPPMASTATGSAVTVSVADARTPVPVAAKSPVPVAMPVADAGRDARRRCPSPPSRRLLDDDGLPAPVPPAVRADDVRQLGPAALRARAARRRGQAPGARPAAAALGLGRLLLGNGHRTEEPTGPRRGGRQRRSPGPAAARW